MNYQDISQKCKESSFLISMVSVDEIIRFGFSIGLDENSNVLDLCCGYGEVLKIWNQTFHIRGTGVDICDEFIMQGQQRLQEAGITQIRLVEDDVTKYNDSVKYDVVLCSETIDSIENTLTLGEKYLKPHGTLVYCKTYSKISNPPQELVDFEEELYPLDELNTKFHHLGYYITHMASDSVGEWERYITWSAKRDIAALRKNPNDEKQKVWIEKWYTMYFNYRRPYEGQALFGLEKL